MLITNHNNKQINILIVYSINHNNVQISFKIKTNYERSINIIIIIIFGTIL